MDWKAQLSGLKGGDDNAESSIQEEPRTILKKDPIRIELEKRNGKPVTFISGFLSGEKEVEQIAKILKVKCGCGGSQKKREILIQGDIREKAAHYLEEIGYSKIRIIGRN